jgi:hypothetical protein
MSFENEGLTLSWDEIKAASRRILRLEGDEQSEKKMVREYLSQTHCDDARVKEHIAIPGYN